MTTATIQDIEIFIMLRSAPQLEADRCSVVFFRTFDGILSDSESDDWLCAG